MGPQLCGVPIEEVFFFVVQTYHTSVLYLILNKATTHAAYLHSKPHLESRIHSRKRFVTWLLCAVIILAAYMVWKGGRATYLGLIMSWSGPFMLLLWTLSGRFAQRLPLKNTALPILLSTVYLWVVDTIALRRGTWVIQRDTKTGFYLWPDLEIEEALFFLVTNTMTVFGMLAFDNALAVFHAFPATFPTVTVLPPPTTLVRALLLDSASQELGRVTAIQEAMARLQKKSRSFHFASAFFAGRLRIDLTLLYSFCRAADDLIDNAATPEDARRNVLLLRRYLDLRYAPRSEHTEWRRELESLIESSFPPKTHSALLYLPTDHLPGAPLYRMIDGFETDLKFSAKGEKNSTLAAQWPIADEADLETYASRVAGTVAELCISLILHHTAHTVTPELWRHLVSSGNCMGMALQYVNIARDIAVDARMGRVYLPTEWLKASRLTHGDVLTRPGNADVLHLRAKVLRQANRMYEDCRSAIEQLPEESRAAMRVAVESYMEIGRALKSGDYQLKAGRASLPAQRRFMVAWKALYR
ncbi:phytoene synthase [Beauveria brongniartii RCEF 3172]|uniref:Bifunctional lycopene cyclase/phytoene synthase n=1 Tax=Beauveria brongniartii RCEF 3172 TaxID=1081107 RepID=A0A166XEK2_9HYPO|nr:phytoene synthase [Beauveria brongniartii RCEF 3172]